MAALSRQAAGKLGEDRACRALEREGYAILARRYRSRFGEIDIVCERDGRLAFVEVKARRTAKYGLGDEAVPGWKRRRIGAMALDYLACTGRFDAPCTFLVVAVDAVGLPAEHVRIIEDAWELGGR